MSGGADRWRPGLTRRRADMNVEARDVETGCALRYRYAAVRDVRHGLVARDGHGTGCIVPAQPITRDDEARSSGPHDQRQPVAPVLVDILRAVRKLPDQDDSEPFARRRID